MLTTSYPRWQGDLAGWFVERLCRHLADEWGIETTVLAPGDPGAPAGEQDGGVRVRRLAYFWPRRWQKLTYGDGIPDNLRRHPLAWVNLPFLFVSFARALGGSAAQADLVHAHWCGLGALAVAMRPLHRRPVVLSVRGRDLGGGVAGIGALARWAVRRADAVIANAPDSHRRCAALRGEKGNCHLIYNGVQTPPQRPPEQQRRFRQASPDAVNFVTVGRLIRPRRQDLLISALADLQHQYPHATLTIVGGGQEFENLRAQAERLGVGGKVRLTGPVGHDQVWDYLLGGDVYVSATEVEAFGNAVAEAAACGLPVITTAVGFPATIVLDGLTGWIVPPGDGTALRQAMGKMLADGEFRASAGRRMQRRLEELELTWHQSAARTRAVYQDLARWAGARPGRR